MEPNNVLPTEFLETVSEGLNSTLSNGSAPEQPRKPKDTLAYAHFVIGTYILIANSLVVSAVARYSYLKTRANIYIVSLAGTDICVGLMEIVVGLHNHSILREWFDRNGVACVGMFSFAFFSVACSMFNMVLIALDRLLYITKPFYYSRKVTSSKVKLTIGIVWMMALMWGSLPLFINHYDDNTNECTMQLAIPVVYRSYVNVPMLFTGAITTGVVYILIARTALRHKKVIYKSIPQHSSNTEPTDLTEAAKSAIDTMRSNMKTLKLFLIVFGLLVICWFPYYILEFTSEFIHVPDAFYRASTALGFLNSGVNFFVYPLYNKNFRRAMRHMVCPCCPGANRRASDTSYTTSSLKSQGNKSGGPPRPVLGHFAPASPPATLANTSMASPTVTRLSDNVDLASTPTDAVSKEIKHETSVDAVFISSVGSLRQAFSDVQSGSEPKGDTTLAPASLDFNIAKRSISEQISANKYKDSKDRISPSKQSMLTAEEVTPNHGSKTNFLNLMHPQSTREKHFASSNYLNKSPSATNQEPNPTSPSRETVVHFSSESNSSSSSST